MIIHCISIPQQDQKFQ